MKGNKSARFSRLQFGLRSLAAGLALLVVSCGSGDSHPVSGSSSASPDAGDAEPPSGMPRDAGHPGDSSLGEAGAGSQAVCDGGSVAPVWPDGAKLTTVSGAGAVTLAWPAASGADRYRIFSDDVEIATVTALKFVAPAAPSASHKFRVDAAELCGKSATGPDATASSTAFPDPAALAPPLPTTGITPFPKAVSFLYTGDNPVQIGVKAGAIDDTRVSVLRGKVANCDGSPAAGVKISVPSEPNLGWTFSRSDGTYDLAVNGGCCQIGAEFDAPGSPPVQRKITTTVNDYVSVPDVVIVPYDTKVTLVTPSDSAAVSAEGSSVKDSAGTRHATVIFPPGVTASMTLQDGTEAPLPSLHVRATEYTSDACGVNAMPATLPAESAFTYAAELSADEAIQANAKSVNFSKPVALYVDNFVGFPNGTGVPTGFYDRNTECWQAVPNGTIVKITAIIGGAAQLDIDGDGQADSAEALSKLGVTPEETQELAKSYAAGTSLWRAPLPHFSPWDTNWPYRPTVNVDAPRVSISQVGIEVNPDFCEQGSDIGCIGTSVRESVPIAGAANSLVFSTKNVTKPFGLIVPLTPADTSGIAHGTLDVSVAGRVFHQDFDATPNQVYHLSWDRKDAYGRFVVGSVPIMARLSYFVPASYAPSGYEFADSTASNSSSGIAARQEFELLSHWEGMALGIKPSTVSVGAWELADHAALDPAAGTIYEGGGRTRKLNASLGGKAGFTIETIAGNGSATFSGDEGSAQDAGFNQPWGLALAKDGSLFVSDTENHRIRKITPDGIVHSVAGTGNPGDGPDEGDALQTDLFRPQNMAFDCQGDLYFTDQEGGQFRELTPDGKLHPLPFRNALYFEGLDGPADAAAFDIDDGPTSIATGSDCRVYFASGRGPVMRLDPSGNVSLVAGNPAFHVTATQFAENTPARGSYYFGLNHMVYEPTNGSLLLAGDIFGLDKQSESIIQVTPDGLQHLIAGKPSGIITGAKGDGISALDAGLLHPIGLTLQRDGSIVFIDHGAGSDWIRHIGTDGIISTIAGNGTVLGERIPALGANITGAQSLVVAPDDSIYLTDPQRNRVRHIALSSGFGAHVESPASDAFIAAQDQSGTPADTIAASEVAVPDQSGSMVDVFDKVSGQRLRSFDALTGVLNNAYSYDDGGHLTSVADTFGNTTTYAYDDGGHLLTITSPYGLVTTLHYDPDFNLDSVTNPAGEVYRFTYDAGTKLLTSFQNPAGNVSSFAYDDLGQLSKDSDAAGGSKTLVHGGTAANPTTSITTGLGRVNSYAATIANDGSVTGRTVQRAFGSSSSSATDVTGKRTITYEGGSTLVTSTDPDPRFGFFSTMAGSISIQGGAQSSAATTLRQYQLSDQLNPFSLTSFTETNTIDGKAFSRTYDRLGKTVSTKTPVGRISSEKLNDLGQVVEVDHAGVAPISIAYDNHGRPTSYTQGQRTSTLTYDDHGYVSQTTDALGQVRQFTYDAVGRQLSAQLGATSSAPVVATTYDKNSDLLSLVPPAGAAHSLNYTPVDLLASYVPPKLSGAATTTPTTYSYNIDRQVTDVTRADGAKIHLDYDAATARTTAVTLPGNDGKISFSYDDSATKDLLGTSGPAGTSVQLGYTDGLVSSLGWSGTVNGIVRKAYDGKFKLASESVDGFFGTNRFIYDDDGLLIGVDFMSISREPTTGRVSGTSLNAVTDARSYDATYGEPSEYKASAFGSALFDVTYARDLLGRITEKDETINGATTKYVYAYDDQGRLQTVTTNGTASASYSYDLNGNRTERQAGGTTEHGTYDEQDQLKSYGNNQYAYTAAGELLSKTNGSNVTNYHYDALGNLRSVTLPNNHTIDYEVDAAGRRVGKSVDGARVSGYIYRNSSQLKAVVDSTGNVLSSFTYGPSQVPLVMTTATNTYRIITDHLGSVRLVVDVGSGAVAQRISYDEFGRVTEDTNPGFQPFGYAGGLYDSDTALVHFGARDYDPEIGRWTTKDPISLSGGFNLYIYVGNDPINLSDISGLLAGVPDWLLWLDDHGVLQGAGDFSAGVSSALTFGLSDKLIAATGLGKYGSRCSGAYLVGNVAGQALFIVGGSLATLGESTVAEGAEALRSIPGIEAEVSASDAKAFQAYRAELAQQEIEGADVIGSALKDDAYHRSASFVVDEIGENGKVFTIDGATGQSNYQVN